MSSVITIQSTEELFSPSTLQEICRVYCSSNVKALLLASPKKNRAAENAVPENSKLNKSVQLPVQVWEGLLNDYHGVPEDYFPLLLAVLKSRKNLGLKNIHLPNTPTLTDVRLRLVMANYPFSIDIHNCPALTKKAVTIINEFGQNLECLNIGNSTHILPIDVDTWIAKLIKGKRIPYKTPQGLRKIVRSITNLFNGKSVTDEDRKTHGLLTTPKLKRLVVWGLHVSQLQQLRINNVSSQERVGEGDINANAVHVDYWEYLTRDFIHELQHLDLSSCQEITDLSFLLKAKDSLKSLYLHDVLLDYDDKTWGILKHLNGLQFLDVSQYNELASVFPNPDAILDGIVTVLPHLVGLDISGTNLAGFEPDGLMPCGIMGLKSRKQTPLKFLGLLTTHYNASCRRNIPATNIAGGNHMEHLLIALQCYLKRENTIKKVIRMLYEKVQVTSDDTFLPSHTILRFLVQAVKNHVHDKHTQIVAMAVMYHVLRRIYQGPTKLLGKVQRDQVMYCISKAMKVHSHDFSLLRNGMLNILLLTPYINMRQYMEDITPVLLEVGKAASADSFMMKAVAYILYNLTRSLPKNEKESLGEIEIVEKLCAIVDDLLRNESLDQMLIFWTLLWNITDDLPSNCERFVKAKGIEICFRYVSICLDGLSKPESNCGPVPADLHEAQIPMFALLSNLLQHSSFATKIIKPEYITNVFNLLEKEDSADNEKLLFHTCGFLCNVVSKELSSSLEVPTRQEILDRILHITKRLDFKKQFDYDFRYLIPLTSLLEVKDAPEIHVWVLWTLVNLTETNPNKYTSLVASDERLKKWLRTDRFNLPYENKCSAENLRLSEILMTRLGTGTPKQS